MVLRLQFRNCHLAWRAPQKVPGTDPNAGFPLDFQWFTNTGYLLIENAVRFTGRVGCTACYVCSHPSLILWGRTKSKPSRTSLTAGAELCRCPRIHNPPIKIADSGQSEQIGKYKFSSSRGTWIDKIQLNNLETALKEDCQGLKKHLLPDLQLSHHSQALK